MNIAVLTGGNSSEYLISVKSAAQVSGWLTKAGHRCFTIDIRDRLWKVKEGEEFLDFDHNHFGFTGKEGRIDFDFAWIILHGTPGEDGKLQGYLDIMGIPYNGSGVLSSALSFNKYACKSFLAHHGILTPRSALIRKEAEYKLEDISRHTGFPCFVKPNAGGSSFGISRVERASDLQAAIDLALKEDDEVIIESFVKGRELTCGLMKTKAGHRVFPLTEILTDNTFFDYEAKYSEGKAREITPAPVDQVLGRKCGETAIRIYDLCNAKGIVRIDFIIDEKDIYFLELNAIPGMSARSIVPKQLEKMGRKMEDVLQEVIDDVLN